MTEKGTHKLREHYLTTDGRYNLFDFQDKLTLMGYISQALSYVLDDATPYTLNEIISNEGIELKITEKELEDD